MLLVQKYLLNKSFNDLSKEHGVDVSLSPCYSKISLNYSQINSSNNNLLSNQCRGLILSKTNGLFSIKNNILDKDSIPQDTKIVAYPFNRFFNFGMLEAKINWQDNNIRCYEKLDGTLIILYFDFAKNNWFVATRSVSEANINITNQVFNFTDLFLRALNNINLSFEQLTSNLLCTHTYMFELTSGYNQVVVKYDETSLSLLGVRDNISLKELNINDIDFPIKKVKSYSFTDVEYVKKHIQSIDPQDHEGVVLVDSDFNRVKFKSEAYVSLHHTISNVGSSRRNLMKLILLGHDDDVVSYLNKELLKDLLYLKNKLMIFSKKVNLNFKEFKNESDNSLDLNKRKEFALILDKNNISWKTPYFCLYKDCEDFNNFIEFSKKEGTWNTNFIDLLLTELDLIER